MSTTIDQRVVEMQFNNKQFESNVQTSLSTLDKLKQSLNLSGASRGLEAVSNAAKNNNMGVLGSAVESVGLKFDWMYSVADQTMRNITNSVERTATRMLKALTIDPIKTGFQEYETQINAVQTILANTQSKGTNLDQVNAALDELNTYADKTIYNFTEMTRNIGTFTAAGVDLDTSVNAIQGIANLAAISGSNSQQASTAMYQLSQALATGTVKLMDWNSVVNAGMGGQVFQDALKETSKELNTGAEAAIKANGSFRESLQTGWLTSEVLTQTLKKFTTSGANEYVAKYTGLSVDAVEAALKNAKAQYGEADAVKYAAKELAKKSGKSEKEIAATLNMAKTAEEAATKVKTFTQLWDTLKEAAQSGWTQTWEIIVGDFEEAKGLLTQISDTIGAIIGKSAEARNKLLQGWKELGGRDDLIASFKNAFEALSQIIKPIGEAFREIFPPTTAKQLYNITAGLKSFTENLKISEETADKIKRTFKGVFSIFDIFRKVLGTVSKAIFSAFTGGAVSGIADFILSITAAIGDFFTSLNDGIKLGGLADALSKIMSTISGAIGQAVDSLDGFWEILSKIGQVIGNILKFIGGGIKDAFSWVAENLSFADIFAGLAGGGVLIVAKKLSGVLSKIKKAIASIFEGKKSDIKGWTENISEILGSVNDSLQAFVTGIKVGSLVAIAIAIGILSASLRSISKLKGTDIAKSLFAIATMFTMLTLSFAGVSKALNKFEPKGVVRASFAMVLMAESIKILSDAVVKIGKLKFGQIIKGLIGVGGGLAALCLGMKAINGVKINLRTSIAMLALAESCKILGDALGKFGDMKWGEIARGLAGMGGALAELVGALYIIDKIGGKSIKGSISLLIAVQSLGKLAKAMKTFGGMKWGEIIKGLSGMGGALSEVAIISGTLGKSSGFSGLLGSSSLVIGVKSLSDLVDSFKKFAEIPDWDSIAKGLSGMGGALAEVALISGTLGKLTGFSGLLGSGALLIAVQSLGKLADAFKIFGTMTWEEISRGLVGMGGALLELGIISGGLGYLTNIAGILGGASIWVAVQGLGDLASAFKIFGSMSWDEIGRGLTAMGSALGELAIGGLANTLSIIGSWSISTVADDLGILADSVKKWADVKVPEGLGGQLAGLAGGILAFTFDGLGALSISLVAGPLGTMADSIKKWSGVSIPEGLEGKLKQIARGVGAFTWEGLGSSAISTVAGPLGTMADSIKKWSGVTIPEGLETNMKGIANGVKAFSFAFMGGWSLSAIVTPLGNLADSVKKWSGVSIPDTLSTGLSGLAKGVKSFSFAFMGGWSLSALVTPLGSLVDSVKKWNGVSIPENLSSQLSGLAKGVKSFSFAFLGGWSLDTVAGPLGTLATSVKKWNGVSVPKDIGTKLESIADGVKAFRWVGDISNATKGMSSIASSVSKLNGINFNVIGAGLNTLGSSFTKFSASTGSLSGVGKTIVDNIVKPIQNASGKLSNAGAKLVGSLSKGIKSRSGTIVQAMNSVISSSVKLVSAKANSFSAVGTKMSDALSKGIAKGSGKVKSSVTKNLSTAAKSASGYYDDFYRAGSHLVDGFASGISANSYKAAAKSRAMAQAAKQAAEDALGIESPSKEFYKVGNFAGLGFINALGTFVSKAYDVSENVADSAKTGLNDAVGKMKKIIEGGVDAQPTIRPVLDLSSVNAGVDTMNSMLNMGSTIGVSAEVNAASRMMSQRNQNGVNTEIVSAINKLRKDIGNIGGTTYIDGITYDDGSNVSEAVKTLVRAARVERRI